MIREVLALGALLSLGACITVEDFGAYWDKAVIDKELEGGWVRLAANDQQARDSSYGVGTITRFDGQELKTLNVGGYKFLVGGPKTGHIFGHYKITNRTLEICGQLGPAVVEFVRTRFPTAVNIRRNKGEGEYITIALFDDEVFRILAQIPDEPRYWYCDQKYERVQ